MKNHTSLLYTLYYIFVVVSRNEYIVFLIICSDYTTNNSHFHSNILVFGRVVDEVQEACHMQE